MSSISLCRCTKELPQEAMEGDVIYLPFNLSFICRPITPISETFQNFPLK